jgi:hypothetical protein
MVRFLHGGSPFKVWQPDSFRIRLNRRSTFNYGRDILAPPVDPACDNVTNPCIAPLSAAYSDPSNLNATSLRLDYNINRKVTLFGRYNHAPSNDSIRTWEEVLVDDVDTDTATVGGTVTLAPSMVNEFRGNWSRTTGSVIHNLTDYRGAVAPPASLMFPAPFSPNTGQALVVFPGGDGNMEVRAGALTVNRQRQLNFIDTLSWTLGTHQLKLGIDYRHLRPTNGESTGWFVDLRDYSSLLAGTVDSVFLSARDPFSVNISNSSIYAQDTWKAGRRSTFTYGLRWEINTPPSGASGQPLYVTHGAFDSLPPALVPGSLWNLTLGNVAPRIGAAFQVTSHMVVRGGYGLFYDLGYGDVGSVGSTFPYNRDSSVSNLSLPFDPSSAAFQPPPFSTTLNADTFSIPAIDPHLQLPFTMEWNAAFEGALGAKQTLTISYVGADGERLLREDSIIPRDFRDLGIADVKATHNLGYSHYNALQVQFRRQLSSGLQALVSYNFSKASDVGSSADSGVPAVNIQEVLPPPLSPADFDIRNSVSGAISYEIPTPDWGSISSRILRGWALDGLLRISSPPPLNVTALGSFPEIGRISTQANIVSGQPYWIPNPTQPGGKVLNPLAFTAPAAGTRGDLPRNGLRNQFSISQTDVALRRRFDLTERVKLDLRAEYFNVFNHPMFGAPGDGYSPYASWGRGPQAASGFGYVRPGYTTNMAMGGGGAYGGQNPLYSVGGPRSGQLTVKISF